MTRRPPTQADDAGGESFLGRWSRRKQLAREEAAYPPRSTAPDAADADRTPAPTPPPTDADMPALETITGSSDVSGFLSSEVSEALRNKALRRLFHSAVFNVRDGLDDYDEDFIDFEKLGDVVTADMRHQMEMEEERRRLAARESGDAAPEPDLAPDPETRDAPPEEGADAADDAAHRDPDGAGSPA